MEQLPRVDSRLDQLQAWLEAGWEIDEPVLQRSVYHTPQGRVCSYEVIVKQRSERRVILLQDVPVVRSFLVEQQVPVLELA